jgi:hypothetical protein
MGEKLSRSIDYDGNEALPFKKQCQNYNEVFIPPFGISTFLGFVGGLNAACY